MNKFGKVLIILMVLVLSVYGFAGCTQAPTTTEKGAETTAATTGTTTTGTETTTAAETTATTAAPVTNWQADTSPITIDVYFNASWMAMQWITDVPTLTFAYITKRTGVTV